MESCEPSEGEEEMQREQGRMELGQRDLALEKHWNRLSREVAESPPLPGGVQGMTRHGIQCSALVGRVEFGHTLHLDLGLSQWISRILWFCEA